MIDILPLLYCLQPSIGVTSVRQLNRIVQAMLAMTGRVTMLGLSRWTGKGGSYRTVQRFFSTALPWATLFWVFFRQHLFCPNEVYLLAGDEVVVTKAGKKTYGLDRFFSSLYGKSVSGLSFFTLSLVSIQQRHSFPIQIEQTLKTADEKLKKTAINAESSEPKKIKNGHKNGPDKPKISPKKTAVSAELKNLSGRPKGSKNKDKTVVTFTPELRRIKGWIQAVLQQIKGFVPLTYLLLDGHFGNNNALQMARSLNLHLISKLRYDSALYFPYENPEPGKKCKRKYGEKLNFSQIPAQFLKSSTVERQIKTEVYQAELLHKEFAQPLNVIILVKTNQMTLKCSHVILFSSDLKLSHDQLIDYYSLRFQIEFNFRDAKQFWGLEDFMNISEKAVTNAANLSFFMVNLSHHLLKLGYRGPGESILDLKAMCRGYKYVDEIVKLLPEKPEPVLLAQIFQRISSLGCIHPPQSCTHPN